MVQDRDVLPLGNSGNVKTPARNGSAVAREVQANEERRKESLSTTTWYLLLWLGCSVGAILIFAISVSDKVNPISSVFRLFSHGVLLAGAAASLGGLIGFLFGIPRTLAPRTKEERDGTTAGHPRAGTIDGPDLPSQAINTNLEDISDWLTKILVGVGLVEFQNIVGMLEKIGIRFEDWLGDSELAVQGVIINFSVWGFFTGYLLTRLFLTNAFSDIMTSESLRQAALKTSRLEQANSALEQDKTEIQKEKNVLESKKTELQNQANLLNKVTEAMNLSAQGKYVTAGTLFQDVLSQAGDSVPEGIKQTINEGSIFNSLYKTPPEGFEEAIRSADRYLAASPDLPSPIILVYKGFAYGQKYAYEQTQGKPKAELDAIRDAAYESIKKALEISSELRDFVRSVWDPPDHSGDRDLESFKSDKGFIELLGGSATNPPGT